MSKENLEDKEMMEAEEADEEVCLGFFVTCNSFTGLSQALWLCEKTEIVLTCGMNQKQSMHPTMQPPKYNPGYVRYEIHLHPTYQVPCLWFSLHDLPVDEPALDVDTVFRRLVPDQYKDGLRSAVGSIGGISADVRIFLSPFYSASCPFHSCLSLSLNSYCFKRRKKSESVLF